MLPNVPRDKADHAAGMVGFESHNVWKGEYADQVPEGPGIQWKANLFQVAQLVQIAPGGLLNVDELRRYFSDPFRKLLSILVNSMGKMNFVAGEVPMVFSVSKYCRVMVFWSTV